MRRTRCVDARGCAQALLSTNAEVIRDLAAGDRYGCGTTPSNPQAPFRSVIEKAGSESAIEVMRISSPK
jgi:hypothetical protein